MQSDQKFRRRAWEAQANATSVTPSGLSGAAEWDELIGEIMICMQRFPDAHAAMVEVLSRKKENQPCPTCGIVS